MDAKGLRAADIVRLTKGKVSAPTLTQILSDERPNPGGKVLEALVLNTEISAHFLLTGEGDPVRMEPKPGHALTPESITELFDRVDEVLGAGGLAPAKRKRLKALALCEHADGKTVNEVIRWMLAVLAAGDDMRAA